MSLAIRKRSTRAFRQPRRKISTLQSASDGGREKEQAEYFADMIVLNKRREYFNAVKESADSFLFNVLRYPLERGPVTSNPDFNDEDSGDDQLAYETCQATWWTLLHIMARFDRIEMMAIPPIENVIEKCIARESLIKFLYDSHDRLPIHYAIEMGHLNFVKLFIKLSKSSVDRKTTSRIFSMPDILGLNCVHYAARANKGKGFLFLLKYPNYFE